MLVGRDAELAVLDERIRALTRGESAVVLVVGAAGLGKSALAQRARSLAEGLGLAVRWASARAARADDAFWLVSEAFGVARPGGEPDRAHRLEPATRSSEHLAAVDAVLEAVEAKTVTPTVVVVEDMHWADPPSGEVLVRLGRRISDVPMIVLLTTRAVPVGLWGDHALPSAVRLELAPLRAEDVRILAGAWFPHADAPARARTEAALAAAGGNPLLVHELLAVLSRRPVGAPADLAGSVLARLEDLDPADRAVVEILAVVGGTDRRTLGALCGLDDGAVLACLDRVAGSGLLRSDAAPIPNSSDVDFRHELLRDAVRQQVPAPVAPVVHRLAARLLQAQGAPPEQVVEHWLAVGDGFDPEAAGVVAAVARSLTRHAPARAVTLFEAAAVRAGPRGLVPSVLADHAQALALCGRPADGDRLARTVLDAAPDVEVRARLYAQLVVSRFVAGHPEDAVEVLEEAERLARDATEAAERVAEMALCLFACGRFDDALVAAGRIDDATPSLAARVLAASVELFERLFRGDCGAARRRVSVLLGVAEQDPRAVLTYQPWFFAGAALFDLGATADTAVTLRRGRALAMEAGMGWAVGLYDAVQAHLHYCRAELDDAEAVAGAGSQMLQDCGAALCTLWPIGTLALVHLRRGAVAEAERLTQHGEAVLAASPNPQLGAERIAMARATLLADRGQTAEAQGPLLELWDAFGAFEWFLGRLWLAPLLLRLTARVGDLALLDRLAAELDESDRRSGGLERVAALAALGRAFAAREPEGAGRWRDAIERAERVGWDLELADVLLDAAEQGGLGPRGGPDEVRAIDRAAAIFHGAGATRDVARAVALLRSRGVTRSFRGSRRGELTATEARVAELVATGRTNHQIATALFISRRTVETHLAHVYRKLGISTRFQLAARSRPEVPGR